VSLTIIAELGEPYRERPVIVEVVSRYVVWVDDTHTTDEIQRDGFACACELLGDRPDPPIDTDVRVEDPDPGDWGEIYSRRIGPDNAPVEGPWWECPACHSVQRPGAPYPRRHMPSCTALQPGFTELPAPDEAGDTTGGDL
jgi:hypothetical protein